MSIIIYVIFGCLDLWHLMSNNYGRFSPVLEHIDHTPLRYLATSLNFTACKVNLLKIIVIIVYEFSL